MPSPFSSLILATSLVALPASPATLQRLSNPAAQSSTPASGSKSKDANPKAKVGGAARATATKSTAAKATATRTSAAKATATSKDAKKADCDTPEPKVVAAKPVPVPTNPFAPVVAPCTDPKP